MVTQAPVKTLSVRTKIVAAIVVSVAALSLATYLFSNTILIDSYRVIEQQAVEEDVRRAKDAINEFANQQMIKLSDWAQWDESYEYALSRDTEWVNSTAYPASLANLDINLMMYADTEGEIFHLLAVDIESREEVSSTSIREYFEAHREPITHDLESMTEGIVMLPEGPMIVVSLPLKTSEGEGPTPGSLTFGRYVNEGKVEDISRITHLALSVYRYNDAALPEDVSEAKAALTEEVEEYVVPLSENNIAGYTLLQDLSGAPALILKVEEERPIYAQGKATFTFFLLVGAAAMIAFGVIILLLLDRLVVSRLERLTKNMEKINSEHDLSLTLPEGVQDEIGRLAGRVNQMLRWLLESKEAEAKSRREIVNLLDSLKKESEQKEEMEKLLGRK